MKIDDQCEILATVSDSMVVEGHLTDLKRSHVSYLFSSLGESWALLNFTDEEWAEILYFPTDG